MSLPTGYSAKLQNSVKAFLPGSRNGCFELLFELGEQRAAEHFEDDSRNSAIIPSALSDSFLPSPIIRKADEDSGNYEAISLGYENVLFPFGWVVIGLLAAVVVLIGEFGSKSLNGGTYS